MPPRAIPIRVGPVGPLRSMQFEMLVHHRKALAGPWCPASSRCSRPRGSSPRRRESGIVPGLEARAPGCSSNYRAFRRIDDDSGRGHGTPHVHPHFNSRSRRRRCLIGSMLRRSTRARWPRFTRAWMNDWVDPDTHRCFSGTRRQSDLESTLGDHLLGPERPGQVGRHPDPAAPAAVTTATMAWLVGGEDRLNDI